MVSSDLWKPANSTKMAAKFMVLVALLAMANARMVRRDTDPMQTIQKQAADFQKTFSEQWTALVNSPNAEQFHKTLKQESDSVLQQLSQFSNSLQRAIGDANGKAKETLEQSKQNIDRHVAELRRQHPDVEQQATQLRQKVEQAVQTAAQESQKLAKEVSANVETTNQKLAPQIQQAVNEFVKGAQDFQKKMTDAVNKQ